MQSIMVVSFGKAVGIALLTLVGIAACSKSASVDIGHAFHGDSEVRVEAVPDLFAVHADVVVVRSADQSEIARVRVIEATDYIEDVRARVLGVFALDDVVAVCMVDPPKALLGRLKMPNGVAQVMLLDRQESPACRERFE